ncbi:1,4-dihydroxy-2-naphthoate polyprenyltransferase [Candidatus Palauibacter sp.]|uniref:1,4-dihydroxy-2-naphthoate polyprenyltransferase n=1 Tax=Candidatus Palauibacter sp. TaxID=3101350 RepID=UPI003B010F93
MASVKSGGTGAWLAGARLRTLPAAAGPVLAGGGLAWEAGGFAAGPFLAALAGALLIQIGTNFSNDYSDFARGADTADRLGTPRVTQAGLLEPGAVRMGAAVSFTLAALFGVYLVTVGGWPIVWIGAAGILAGICYTGGPWPFGYHGLGDLFVFVFFGPVAVAGTAYVQLSRWAPEAVLAGVGAGALATAILVVNNLRDRETDAAAGKRTLAVRIGPMATRVQYSLLLAIALAVPPVGAAAGLWPPGALLASAAVLLAVAPLRTVWSHEDPRDLNPALAATARATGAYGLLFALGCLL